MMDGESRANVLVADDRPANVLAIQQVLEPLNHSVVSASTGEEVLRALLTNEFAVVGYRAPTFSIQRQTGWALDVLAELNMAYDSSIYPVRHDRYGVPSAPRGPFLARGERHSLLELPPATLRLCGLNLPMGGGGYFRLFPLFLTRHALEQTGRDCDPSVATLYFHPWEFDPGQRRLPLRWLSRLRTYVGIHRSQGRMAALLAQYRFSRAVDVAKQMNHLLHSLPCFDVAARVDERLAV